MHRCIMSPRYLPGIVFSSFIFAVLPASADDDFSIDRARWDSERSRLEVRGDGHDNRTITVLNAYDPAQTLGSDRVDDESWRIRVSRPSPVPCRIRAISSDGQALERNVSRAPANCAPKSAQEPPPAPVTLQVDDVTGSENAGTLAFTVSLSAASSQPVRVEYATRNGSAQAGENADYLETNGSLSFPAGTTSASVSVSLVDDQVAEATESFRLELSSAENATIADASGTATIFDDDQIDPPPPPPPPSGPSVSINSTSANQEGALPISPVETQDLINTGTHALLVANDLGMHCADIDYQVFSILPPFNVVHAQVIERGGEPRLLDDSTMEIVYSAASSATDPALANKTAAERGEPVFKGNFWQTLPGDQYPCGTRSTRPCTSACCSRRSRPLTRQATWCRTRACPCPTR